ncbi:MAG: hypothetical protein AUH29_01600 [Candidatus Rokubacteria bacterium 13_1_40CM_69_27]|nr:MAG: hypothetical protein AUH29_01600 [Candidatus Rokubacteria bacterium 13_1_40CM_69_27]OLC32925.1 MAG: hypothetical protein AUH81_15085 [Candidatus Rokubacteria bacterium 13_1_40CM_4_69_5]
MEKLAQEQEEDVAALVEDEVRAVQDGQDKPRRRGAGPARGDRPDEDSMMTSPNPRAATATPGRAGGTITRGGAAVRR